MASAADISTYDKALKETWTSERLVGQFYNENPFLDDIRKTKSYKVGQQAVTPLMTDNTGSYTALPNTGGTLNAADTVHMTQATWNYTHHGGQVKIDSAAIDGTSSNNLSVANIIDTEIQSATAEMRRQITRQAFQAGNALLCVCDTGGASTTVQLDVTQGQNALERGWLHVGQRVDVGTTANEVADVGDSQITAVASDVTDPTITIADSVTTSADTDYISIANSRSGTTSYEMNGLQNIVSASADLGGLTVASNPKWQAAGVDSTSQALDLTLLYTGQRKVHQQTGTPPDYVLTGLKQADNFYQLLQTQVRFSSESEISAGKTDVTKWNGMSINIHPDCQNEYWYFLTKKHLFIVEAGEPSWANSISGGKVLDWIQGTSFFGSALFYRINLCTDRRNAHYALSGLT